MNRNHGLSHVRLAAAGTGNELEPVPLYANPADLGKPAPACKQEKDDLFPMRLFRCALL